VDENKAQLLLLVIKFKF